MEVRSEAVRTMIMASGPCGGLAANDAKHRFSSAENREMCVFQAGIVELANKILISWCEESSEVAK